MDTGCVGHAIHGRLCERQSLSTVPTDLTQRDVAHRLLPCGGCTERLTHSALSIPEDSIAGFTREFDLRAKHMANFATLPTLLKEKGM